MAKLGKPIKTFEVQPLTEPTPQPVIAPETTPAQPLQAPVPA
jgi:hypothetical protein